jgi:hypothetical protein
VNFSCIWKQIMEGNDKMDCGQEEREGQEKKGGIEATI